MMIFFFSKFCKFGNLFGEIGGHCFGRVFGLQHDAVQECDVIESFSDSVVSGVVQRLLGGIDGHRRFRSNLGGEVHDSFLALLRGIEYLGHVTMVQCLFGIEEPPCVGEFSGPTFAAGDFGKPLHGSEIGTDANVDLFDGELGLFRAKSYIAGRCDVETSTYTVSGYRRNHRNPAEFKSGGVLLESQNQVIDFDGLSGSIGLLFVVTIDAFSNFSDSCS